MRIITVLAIFVLGLIIGASTVAYFVKGPLTYQQPQTTGSSEVIGIYFSPHAGCENAVLEWVQKANQSLHILIYSFTLDSIGDALIARHKQNIDVKVVFEKDQISQYSDYQRLRDVGVQVRSDTNSGYMHNKLMVVDGNYVLTGSFNWSSNAENVNDENLVVLRGSQTASAYESEFSKVWDQSES